MILALGEGHPPAEPGDRLTVVAQTEPDLSAVRTAIGAGTHLVSAGNPLPKERPDAPRHPRTAVGWNAKSLFFFVVDGRRPPLVVGMTYSELAALAARYGCEQAVALDGGGSSTMVINARVVNTPSDGEQRPLANALILLHAAE
jgi:exopolysaccharide biosynthesis protein